MSFHPPFYSGSYPYGPSFHRMRWSHRRGRGLFWLAMGSFITYTIMKCQERKVADASPSSVAPQAYGSTAYGGNPPQNQSMDPGVTRTHKHSWGWRHRESSSPSSTAAPAGIFESERVQEMRRQASETMSELSEATIDSAIANLQSIRAKLAERRVRLDEQSTQSATEQKQSERWV